MHKGLIGFIAIFILFTGCAKEKREAPLLNREETISLLVDMHTTDAMLMRGVNRGKIKKDQMQSYYKGVLVKHGITRKQFDSVVDYYSHDYKQLEKMYDEVLTRIQQKEKKLTLERQEKKDKK